MGFQVTRTRTNGDMSMEEYFPTKIAQTECNKNKQGFQYPVPQNEYGQFQIPAYTFALVTSFSSVIFLVGIVGNLVVMFIILRNRDMRNATSMCLLSLSAADMLVLCVCMPSALVEFYGKDVWYLGEILCEYKFLLNAQLGIPTVRKICYQIKSNQSNSPPFILYTGHISVQVLCP